MNYSILTGPHNPILRSVSDTIDHFGNDIAILARDLKLVCHQHDGMGLAAPQIGIPLRIIYTTQRKKTPKWLKYIADQIMINPELVEQGTKTTNDIEWCLSLPGIEGKVRRYDDITIRYQDIHWASYTKRYTWFDARVIQHEIDHLDGILFIDKTKDVRKVSKKS